MKTEKLKNKGSLKTEDGVVSVLLTKKQLAFALQLSVSFIDVLISEEDLPHFKIGKAIRFNLEEIMAFLERRKRP